MDGMAEGATKSRGLTFVQVAPGGFVAGGYLRSVYWTTGQLKSLS